MEATTTQQPKKTNDDDIYFNFEFTNALTDEACDHIEELLDALGVELKEHRKMYVGMCPIHGGDNIGALNLYPDGDIMRGNWKCRTHQCEKKWSKTLIGFIRGVLSQGREFPVTWQYAVDWLCSFLGKPIGSVKIDVEAAKKRRFNSAANILNKRRKSLNQIKGLPREKVVDSLIIPADYYIERGYSADILAKYDVGLCRDMKKRMRNRVVVPIYDDKHKYMVGCSGRSIFPQCPSCKLYHRPQTSCPKQPWEIIFAQKWLLSKDFVDKDHLYNYWFAKKYIEDTGVAILVEGPGDVWRLEEQGIHMSLALFGTELTDAQLNILEASGAMSLIVITDNDKAGKEAAERINTMCNRMFRLYFPTIHSEDVGAMQSDEITEDIKPIIEQVLQQAGV